ncbi:MAG: DUF1854 domain-containing protein [Gemmataceae bacterium]
MTNGEHSPFQLHTDAWHRLVFTAADGTTHTGVDLVRAFPLSKPDACLSICDAAGKEIAWIDELSSLPAGLRQLIEQKLAERDFLPVIQRIERIARLLDPPRWDVITDRGPASIRVNENEVRPLGAGGALIIDADGIRYQIPEVAALDGESRRLLERLL